MCKDTIDCELVDLKPLFETILSAVPAPVGDPAASVQVLVTNVIPDNYRGPLAIGRVINGSLINRQRVVLCHRDGTFTPVQVSALFQYSGLGRVEAESAGPGDIIAIGGMVGIGLGESIADAENPIPLEPLHIDEPTMSMEFRINDSPFAGREGKYVTSRNLKDRLAKEGETNLSMKIEATDSADSHLVYGRGELQMAILIEQMRREGFEFSVGMPNVITKEIN